MNHQEIINNMSREEKFKFLTGVDMNHSYAMPRHGIEEMAFHDSPFGVKKLADSRTKPDALRKAFAAVPNCEGGKEVPATAFPNGCALGATWDVRTVEEVGEALGSEFRAYGINAIMGPAVNIKRHPLCGRNFEYMSEDPMLSGELGAAYTKGVQSQGVASCPKHYIANNQERGRFVMSSEMDERSMREIYLRPFEPIVKKAHPWSMMCAYNRINGVHASEHKQLLQEILRDEWGFDGIIVSDWGSVHNRAVSLLASVEMCMPYQADACGQLEEAYEQGLIDDEVVDAAVDQLLTFYDRTAAVREDHEIDFEHNNQVTLKAARKSMTLLKNDGQLPLNREKVKKLLVIGDRAKFPFYGGDGSSKIKNPTYMTNPLEEIQKLAGDMEVTFLGKESLDTYRDDIGYFEGTVTKHASQADAVVVFLGQTYGESSETMDRNHMELEPDDEHIVRACARCGKKPVVVLNIGAAVTTTLWEKCAGAILVSWMAGQGMGQAVAETLFGLNNPAGRLAETFPKHQRDVLALQNYPGNGRITEYNEKLMVGYRHFDTNHIEPAYEFGFGLSYSRFTYSNLNLDGHKLTFDITNESDVDGEEVAQVYVSFPEESWNSHPAKELKAFRRVAIRAGETVTVEIELTDRDFQYYNPALHRWVSETGTYTVKVGTSSRNLPLAAKISVTCEEPIYTEACVMDGEGVEIMEQFEISCLRTLAAQVAAIATLPAQQEKAKLWTAHNDLKTDQPLVWIDPENGWNELIPPESLLCQDPMARGWELELRRRIYWHEVLKDDHVIDANLDIPYVFTDDGWGVDIVKLGGENGGAYKMKTVIEEYEEDFEKLHYPQITIDWEQSKRNLALAQEVFDGLLNVRLKSAWWWSLGMTWDYIDLRGLESFLCDIILAPEWVHRMMDLLCQGQLHKLDFLEQNGLLSSNTGNSYVGSGGIGYTTGLPQKDGPVTTMDMWGFVESQETSSINPDAYGEFIFPYHKKMADRFGLNCYGCCEPTNERWKYVRQLPRLLRVSYSPWADWSTAPEYLGKNYVTSLKPIPTPLSTPIMDEDTARADIRRALEMTRGCILEILMKDTHTLGNNPRNAARWVEIVREEIDRL